MQKLEIWPKNIILKKKSEQIHFQQNNTFSVKDVKQDLATF